MSLVIRDWCGKNVIFHVSFKKLIKLMTLTVEFFLFFGDDFEPLCKSSKIFQSCKNSEREFDSYYVGILRYVSIDSLY